MRNYEDREEQQSPRLDFSRRPGISKKGQARANRTMRMRLLSLFGLLIIVVVAMKEAGKPERWMWLGFDDANSVEVVANDDVSSSDILVDSPTTDAQTRLSNDLSGKPNGSLGHLPNRVASLLSQTNQESGSDDESDSGSDEDEGFVNGGDFDTADVADAADSQRSPLALDFWESTFVGLAADRKEAFYELLRRVDASKLDKPAIDLPFAAVLKELTKEHGLHQSKMLGELAVMSKGQAKTELTKQLFAFDQSWQNQVLPTLEASVEGQDFTLSDQTVVRSIRSIVDPIVLRSVEDRTGMGNPRDKMAWFAIWDQIQKDALSPPQKTSTTLLQLNGQPAAFRGKPVTVSGTAKTIRKKILKDSLLNVPSYYEMWIDPDDGANIELICVYAAKLPKQFEANLPKQSEAEAAEVKESFVSIEVPVTVSGRFFKLRSYQDRSRAVSHSPVLIAKTFTANFPTSAAETNEAWLPSFGLVMTFLSCAMAAAIAIAWVIYRSTKSGSSLPNKPASSRVSSSLDRLTDNDSILTDAERVDQLNKVLDEDYS